MSLFITYFVHSTTSDNENKISSGWNDNKKIAFMSSKAPQIVLEKIVFGYTWQEAFDHDWRKTKSWKPGWEYILM